MPPNTNAARTAAATRATHFGTKNPEGRSSVGLEAGAAAGVGAVAAGVAWVASAWGGVSGGGAGAACSPLAGCPPLSYVRGLVSVVGVSSGAAGEGSPSDLGV